MTSREIEDLRRRREEARSERSEPPPPHWHPADEHVTVISGKLLMGMGDTFDASKLKPFPAGSFLVMPAKSTHFPTVKTETVLQVHAIGPWSITYVNPADDPRQAKKAAP